MTDTAKRTPGKLRLSKVSSGNVVNEKERLVASCMGYSHSGEQGKTIAENKANAAYIVQAWNAHDALVKALEKHVNWWESNPDAKQGGHFINEMRAALKLAKEGA